VVELREVVVEIVVAPVDVVVSTTLGVSEGRVRFVSDCVTLVSYTDVSSHCIDKSLILACTEEQPS